MFAEFPFIFVEEVQLGYIGNEARGALRLITPLTVGRLAGRFELKDNHNGRDKSRSWITYKSPYLKGGNAL